MICPKKPVKVKNRPVRGQFCDVKFNVGRETIPFYKIILAQKSDVFETMFSSPVTDPLKANDPIEIKDASATSFKAFLDVVYNGQRLSDARISLEVLEIAEKYNCDYVKQIVGDSLCKKITEENAADILETAKRCGIESLEDAVMKFSRKNRHENPADGMPVAKRVTKYRPRRQRVF